MKSAGLSSASEAAWTHCRRTVARVRATVGLAVCLLLNAPSCFQPDVVTINGRLVTSDGMPFRTPSTVLVNELAADSEPTGRYFELHTETAEFRVEVAPGRWSIWGGAGTCLARSTEVVGAAGDTINLSLLVNCVF
jgi:hypothetical protein